MLLKVVVPIIVQNAITNFVNLLDNIMVGQTGTESMTGVSVANQLMFVFNIIIFGAISGAGIFTAQYYGQGDNTGVKYTLRFKVIICLLMAVMGIVVFTVFSEPLVSLYMSDAESVGDPALTLGFGKEYLMVMVFGLAPFALAQAYSSTLRETGETMVPMVGGIAAVVTNLCLNYVLIFGKFGAPALGVVGAAIATVISRYVELAIVIIYAHTHGQKHKYMAGLYRGIYIPASVTKKIIIKGLPLLLNEAFWSLGMAAIAQCYSTRGLDVVSANNISTTVSNLFNVVFISLGSAVAIIVGNALGSGDVEKAVDLDRKLIFTSIWSSAILGAMLCGVAPFFPLLYNTEPEIRALATKLIIVVAVTMPLHAFLHACYFTLRSGGKTFITFLFDSVSIWAINYVLVFSLTHWAPLVSVPIIMLCDHLSNIVKCIVGSILVKKRIWVQNLVGDKISDKT
ncbi:MAG: MATE family efflux transporter [Oscillospiraceae bacterium]|nr:MATE family efflux transporter [Oscillospiraceae bacterium]